MAEKKIYIPNGDLIFFKQAEDFSGKNISRLIRELVKNYVNDVKSQMDDEGFWIVSLEVGEGNRFTPKKFKGKLLGGNTEVESNNRHIYSSNPRNETDLYKWCVYLTKKRQILLYQSRTILNDNLQPVEDRTVELYPDFESIRQSQIIYKEIYKSKRSETYYILGEIEIPTDIIEWAENIFYRETKDTVEIEDI